MPGVISTFRDGDYSNVVDKRIGDAYLIVKEVQENLPAIIEINANFDAFDANAAAAIAAKDLAEAAAVQTGTDATTATTQADITTANAALTADDAIATAADRVQTGLDRADTQAAAAGTVIRKFATYAEQMAYTGVLLDGQRGDVLGYTAIGDGGGIAMYWDATSTATHNGGTVRHPTVIGGGAGRWLSLETRITPNIFGAKGDSSSDDTTAIIAAVAALPTGRTLYGNPASTYKVSSRIDFNNKNLQGLTFTYSADAASIVLIGNAKLKDVTVYVGTTSAAHLSPLSGAVNLHLADGAVIDNLTIPDGTASVGERTGIYCSTRASNVEIKNCTANYIGFGLLYNDGSGGGYPAGTRIVDGTDYATATIGKGLTITNCSFGAADKTRFGDGIEINCPTYRFSDVRVYNCVVNKAIPNTTNGPNGIGMGFANIDGLLVDGCYIKDSDGGGGGLHCEKSVGVIFSNNIIVDCWKGIGVGDQGDDIVIANNVVIRSDEAVQIMGNTTSVTSLSFTGNCILDTVDFPFAATNINDCIISNNLFRNCDSASNAFITLLQTGALTTKKVTISNNNFRIDNGIATLIGGYSGTVMNCRSFGNMFNGVSSNSIAGYMSLIRAIGICEDYYDSTGTGTGLRVSISRTPVGYIIGTLGDLATDTTDGITYRHNGTDWIPRMGFSAKGLTAARPTLGATDAGVIYFDQTLAASGKPIWWTGTVWVDSTGVVV